jgi:hypothetical protein
MNDLFTEMLGQGGGLGLGSFHVDYWLTLRLPDEGRATAGWQPFLLGRRARIEEIRDS